MWMSALGRAIFGFYSETHKNPYFANDDYIKSLCDTQNRAETAYGKTVLHAFVLSIISIATANDAIGDASYLGLNLSQIPYLTEFCSLTLSAFVALLVFQFLDIFTMARMRQEIFSLSGSENPNMRMLHFKGNGAWIDALIPKTIGYKSKIFHRVIQFFVLCWSLTIPTATLLMILAAQAICILSVMPLYDLELSDGIAWVGIAISTSSIFTLFFALFVPLKFTLSNSLNGNEHQISDNSKS